MGEQSEFDLDELSHAHKLLKPPHTFFLKYIFFFFFNTTNQMLSMNIKVDIFEEPNTGHSSASLKDFCSLLLLLFINYFF